MSDNNPANKTLFSQLKYYGRKLFNARIVGKGDNGDQVLAAIDQYIHAVDRKVDLSCYEGQVPGCVESKENCSELGLILNQHLSDIQKLIDAVQTANTQGGAAAVNTLAGKILAGKADGVPGFLTAKLTSPQPTALKYDEAADTLSLIGTVPVGTVLFITKAYLKYFGNDGLGIQGSDYFPFAIANGKNGTDNLFLDMHLKLPKVLDDASSATGRTSFVVKGKNIESLDVSLGGQISNGLTTNSAKIGVDVVTGSVGAGSSRLLALPPDGAAGNVDVPLKGSLEHSHSHSLKVAALNQAVEAIELNPRSFILIPIQRIKR